MITKFIEVTNGPRNWGKFMLGRFTQEEWERESNLPDADERAVFTHGKWSLLRQRGWTPDHLLVMDLETAEGAIFLPGGSASADLNKHRIWVCPMFEPFLEWLYAQRDWLKLDDLPNHVDLPDASFAMAGYRRPGPSGG